MRKPRSDGSFKWKMYGPYYKRCQSERCNTCMSGGRHGPYYQIARTNPHTRGRETVYLGEAPLTDEAIDRLNDEYAETRPTRAQVLELI
jgi:hypothetical protein